MTPFAPEGWEQLGPLRWERRGWVVYPDGPACWAAQIGDLNPTDTYRVFLTSREAFGYADKQLAETA